MYCYRNSKGRMNQPERLPSKYKMFTDKQLSELGWYPCEIEGVSLEDNEVISHYELVFNEDVVTATPIIHQITEEEFDDIKTNLINELAALRYKKETLGVTVDGSVIRTDRESQAMLTGAKVFSDLNPEALIDWKGEFGWTKIDQSTLATISNIVGNYMQKCFSQERVHHDAISSLTTMTEIKRYDINSGWPTNIIS